MSESLISRERAVGAAIRAAFSWAFIPKVRIARRKPSISRSSKEILAGRPHPSPTCDGYATVSPFGLLLRRHAISSAANLCEAHLVRAHQQIATRALPLDQMDMGSNGRTSSQRPLDGYQLKLDRHKLVQRRGSFAPRRESAVGVRQALANIESKEPH